jgi:hypothetical protein
MKKIKIPITWVEYHHGELVVEVPDNMTEEELIEKIKAEGTEHFCFCNTEFSTEIIDDGEPESDQYEIYEICKD